MMAALGFMPAAALGAGLAPAPLPIALALALDWLSSRANNVKGGRRTPSTRRDGKRVDVMF